MKDRFIKVILGSESGEAEAIVMRRDGVTALDVLGLLQGVAALFDMEALAQAEGRTFGYSKHAPFGAVSPERAAELREAFARIRPTQTEAD